MHHLPTVARNIGAETTITANMKVKNVSLNVMLSFMNAVLGAGLSNPRVIEAAESSSAMVDIYDFMYPASDQCNHHKNAHECDHIANDSHRIFREPTGL